MNTEHPFEELSAYLDGEAQDPAAVARHLEQCPECARRCEELRGLSSALQALPGPEVHPAFVTRVIAHAAESRVALYRRWLRLGLPLTGLTAAAAAVALALVTVLRGVPMPQRPVISVAERPSPAITESASSDMGLTTSDDPETPVWAGDSADETSTEDLLAALSDSDGFTALTGDWEQSDDVDLAIAALDDSEAEILKNLVTEYAKELDNYE